MDQLNAMRVAVAVATEGSFIGAARLMRLSPSVVTRTVSSLEDRLGLTLFARTTRAVRLTERGGIYIQNCREILEDVANAESRARGEHGKPSGELTIAAPLVFGRVGVLPIVNQLLSDHKNLSVRLILSDRNVQLVEDGVDVAVRIGDLADSRLFTIRLGEVSRVVAGSPAYLKNAGRPKTPADITRHQIVAFDGLDATNEWRFRAHDKVVRVEPRLTVNSADAAILAAEAGIGLTRVLSYQLSASVMSGRLVPVLREFQPPPIPISALYPSKRVASPNTMAFVSAAREHFKMHPLAPPRGKPIAQ